MRCPEALHSWRKRVKDQAAQLRLFRRVVPAGVSRSRIADEKETAELLGNEHDLWLLSRTASRRSDAVGSRRRSRQSPRRDRKAPRRADEGGLQEGRGFFVRRRRRILPHVIGAAWDKASKRKASKAAASARRANGASRGDYFSSAVKTPSQSAGGFSRSLAIRLA